MAHQRNTPDNHNDSKGTVFQHVETGSGMAVDKAGDLKFLERNRNKLKLSRFMERCLLPVLRLNPVGVADWRQRAPAAAPFCSPGMTTFHLQSYKAPL